ncbi:MAG: hypothetical protein O2780_19850 [Proteobacteria bacterium]|nr:hypothetical protein [Pseudomonadota bacterium]MDA1302491.1 hypothetical protein [Pseudomonadota bacterium]
MAGNNISSDLLAAMADGIGEVAFASEDWVKEATEVLEAAVRTHAVGLADVGQFTLCEVGHNAPAWLHCGPKLAWHAKFDGASVQVGSGELGEDECDLKIQGDHSIISNLARIQYHNRDPKVVASAQARLQKLSRWEFSGKMPEHQVLMSVLRTLHDAMAPRTLPRFVFMTPEWVSSARHIVSTRAEKYRDQLTNVVYKFSEEFTDTPKYAFPDGSHGGFWVHCNHGSVTVGAGPLPKELEPADTLTKGAYTPVVPVGRTVNAAMTDEEKQEQEAYSKAAFRFDKEAGKRPVDQTQPSGKGPMGPELGRVMMVLHDELSRRTAGDIPSDYDDSVKPQWSEPQGFDRPEGYDKTWLKYDQFDIYGNPRG